MQFLVGLITLTLTVTVLAEPVPTASEKKVTEKKDSEKKDTEKDKKPLVQNIKLDDYLKNIGPENILEKIDSAGKGSPDIFVLFIKNENGTKQLLMQLFDINRDKKVDLVKHWEKGKMSKTEMDLDYDAIVDVVSEYDLLSGEIKRKIQADGDTNIWKHYFKNELRKKEVDRNSDGKPDLWVYYRAGKVIRTEIDEKFDGRVTRVEGALSPNKTQKDSTSPASAE